MIEYYYINVEIKLNVHTFLTKVARLIALGNVCAINGNDDDNDFSSVVRFELYKNQYKHHPQVKPTMK